ncbi:MAG: OmpA family protein [Rhodospirillales bacterium]|jgi:chemotaxis protein MotB|nr:OmpA family protein [Rhodospirillales bacterium]MDP7214727.1 OmpA family protein [Rhodospirillales bacterium]HIJ42827.1 OmpA family protein [Rhodospirillaceae bacterium]HIJ45407.1 OmpA family protein [Rhodospirillaceae bacterium]HIJ92798.1 OmpA family protein [Rhodospirillaceae bacterium]
MDEDPPLDESWLATYADAITLLMAFFVMLLNFSKIDIPKFEEAAAGIANEIGMGQKEQSSPISIMKFDMQDVVYEMQADEVVEVETDDKGITIELASSAFYKPGSADLRDQALPVLKTMADMFKAPKYKYYNIEIEGHTDDDPISTVRYPSNWELSAGRASGVVRYFISQGIDMERMKAVGYAETQPKLPNRDADGNPIKENQSENRRVIMRIYPMNLDEREKLLRKDELREMAAERLISGSPAETPEERHQ